MITVFCVREIPGKLDWGVVYEVREVLPYSGMLRVLGEGGRAVLAPADAFRPETSLGHPADPTLVAAIEVAAEKKAAERIQALCALTEIGR